MERLKAAIYEVCKQYNPLTIRQLFYLLVVRRFVAKTHKDYKNAVVRPAGKMRDDGELPWRWIVDNSRLRRKPET